MKEFVENLNKKFGCVYTSNHPDNSFATVGMDSIPEFTANINYNPKKTNRSYPFWIEVYPFETKEETEQKLKKSILKCIKSVIFDERHYRHYSIFWRSEPQIEYQIDYIDKQKRYYGFARFNVFEKN